MGFFKDLANKYTEVSGMNREKLWEKARANTVQNKERQTVLTEDSPYRQETDWESDANSIQSYYFTTKTCYFTRFKGLYSERIKRVIRYFNFNAGGEKMKPETGKSTCELTEELLQREGIRHVIVAPHEEFKIVTGQGEVVETGPATIIINQD